MQFAVTQTKEVIDISVSQALEYFCSGESLHAIITSKLIKEAHQTIVPVVETQI